MMRRRGTPSPRESILVQTEDESRHLPLAKKQVVGEEIGDVTILSLALAEALRLDILEAARKKLQRNREK